MIHLFRYVKPYALNVLLVIILLFAQANADLALPDYMSKIVNVGIQQGGISDTLPGVIRKDSLDRAMLFMTAEEREAAARIFVPVSADFPLRYKVSSTEEIYVLDTSVVLDSKPVADGIRLAYVAAGNVERMGGTMEMAQASQGLASIRQRFESLDPMLLDQMGMKAVHDEYQALGIDLGALQTSYILSMGGLMLLLTLLSAVATIMVGFLGSRTAAGLARDLRHDVFCRVEGFSFVEFDAFSTASLITRSTNDITQIQMVTIMGLRMVFYAQIGRAHV